MITEAEARSWVNKNIVLWLKPETLSHPDNDLCGVFGIIEKVENGIIFLKSSNDFEEDHNWLEWKIKEIHSIEKYDSLV